MEGTKTKEKNGRIIVQTSVTSPTKKEGEAGRRREGSGAESCLECLRTRIPKVINPEERIKKSTYTVGATLRGGSSHPAT